MWYLIVYAAVVALGALIGHLRGSVQLGVLWTMVLGSLGLVLLVFTTPST